MQGISISAPVIYTIGHGNRPADELVEILRHHQIQALADVRRFPQSRRNPHFGREALAARLSAAGIEYRHLGAELGGLVPGPYEDYVAAAPFQKGLAELIECARSRRTAFLCAERLPWQCHRRFIARELERRGFQVLHILDRERVWDPAEPLLPL